MVWGATCVGKSGLCEERSINQIAADTHDISTTARLCVSHRWIQPARPRHREKGLTGRFAHRWSTKCERHANAGYEAALARLAEVELDPRVPLDDEAGPRLRVAHYAQILAYFGMKPPVPEPPPVDMRRRNMLRVLDAVSDEATTQPPA